MDVQAESVPAALERSRLGAVLVLASTAFFSLAGVLTKTIAADAWTINGWRGAVGGLIIMAYVAFAQRGAGRRIDLRLGTQGWIVALVSAVSSVFFVNAFKLTAVGNVVVIYATVPFMAAALGFWWLGERVSRRTLLASAAALAGVVLTVSGSLGTVRLLGDSFAVAMTFLCAIYLVMLRAFRDAPTVWSGGVAALLLVFPGFILGDPAAASLRDGLWMTLFGFSFAAAVILWTEGAKRVPAAEAGLLGAAEIPLAMFFAWSLVGERQMPVGLVGATIVVAAVGLHALLEYRRHVPAGG